MEDKSLISEAVTVNDSRSPDAQCDAVIREDIRREILSYVTAGKDLFDVCERFGIDEATAREEITAALSDLRKYNLLLTNNLRDIENARLESALSAIWGGVRLGELDSVNTFINIHKQRRELWGLSAPQKLALTDPTGENDATPGMLQFSFVQPGDVEGSVFNADDTKPYDPQDDEIPTDA